ncbi:MAG: Do family serine endopeptidase [Planctomycetota bacterium]|nr:Do family serine endopeptidase [Planctomycetota bacterium]
MKRIRTWVPIVPAALLLAVVAGVYCLTIKAHRACADENTVQEATRRELAELSEHDRLSALFRAVAKAVKPAVVEVRVTKWIRQPNPEELFRRYFGDDLPFRFRFETPRDQGPNRRFRQMGLGSGVIVDAAKGYVLTNNHVVEGADKVEVVLADKRKFTAEWVRSDPQTDLAVVKVRSERLVAAPLGDSDKAKVGDWVLAIGAPRNLPQTVTAGIISAKGRTSRRLPAGNYQNYIQTDAAINRGNSGGPLVNMRGEVIGLNNFIVSYSGGNEGIGFAIPSNMAGRIMRQLVDTGEVVRGYLGVRIQDVDEKLAESFNLPGTKGALVAMVAEDSPAEKAGLKVGDFIVAVDGKTIENINQLRNKVAGIAPGKKVPVKIYRRGAEMTVYVVLEVQPDEMAGAFGESDPAEASAKGYGIKVATLSRELAQRYGFRGSTRGVIITEVEPGSDAADKGLAPGMVILQVQGKTVATARQFARAISTGGAGEGVRLRVMTRNGTQHFVFIVPAK